MKCTYLEGILKVSEIGDGGWAGHVAHLGEKSNTHIIVVENSGDTEAFGRPKPMWDGNIKLEPKEIK